MSTETKSVALPQSVGLTINGFDDLLRASDYLSKSNLLPAPLRGKPADVALILQMGIELGLPPLHAINGICVIQGRPTVDPQLAIAMIRSRVPGAVIIYGKENGESLAVVTMARSRETMDEGYTATWNDQKARNMDLLGKDNYKKQKGNMLKWRAVMEAARAVFPDVIKGMYAPDELDDGSNSATGGQEASDKTSRLKSLNAKPETKDVKVEVASAPITEAKKAPGATTTVKEPVKVDPPKAEAKPAVIVVPKDAPKPEPKAPEIGYGADLRTAQAPAPMAPEPAPQWDAGIGSSVQSAPSEDPYGDYVFASNSKLGARPLNTIPRKELQVFIDGVKAHFKKLGTAMTGDVLNDISHLDQYLINTAPQPESDGKLL